VEGTALCLNEKLADIGQTSDGRAHWLAPSTPVKIKAAPVPQSPNIPPDFLSVRKMNESDEDLESDQICE
jgi:hypothetical protein